MKAGITIAKRIKWGATLRRSGSHLLVDSQANASRRRTPPSRHFAVSPPRK
jgi:hypothetical protein